MSFTHEVYGAELYIGRHWSHTKSTTTPSSQKPTPFQKEVVARVAHFALIPLSCFGGALDGLIGLGTGVVTAISPGSFPKLDDYTFKQLYSFQEIFTGPFRHFLKTLNPQDKFSFTHNVYLSAGGMGFTTHVTVLKLLACIDYYFIRSDYFLLNKIASRLSGVALAVVCLVTRSVDGIIGIPAAALAIMTFGAIKEINNVAYRALQAPNIVGDLSLCAMMCISGEPQTMWGLFKDSHLQTDRRWF